MTVVIHAGLKKCGSSSIHEFLRANRTYLSGLGIAYPGPHRPGTLLANEIQRRRRPSATLLRLSKYWAEAEADTLIISSEVLEETESHQARDIRDAFLESRKGEKFIILLIIRDLVDLLPSMYAQKVKQGRFHGNFDEFFDSMIKERRVNYFMTASRWADAFGWNSLRIRVLDSRHLVNGDLVDDFLSILNVNRSDSEAPPFSLPGVSNAAPGWRVVELLRALFGGRHGMPGDHPLVNATERFGRLSGLTSASFNVAARSEWGMEKGRYLTVQQAERCFDIYNRAVSELNQHVSYPIPAPTDLLSRAFVGRTFLPDADLIPFEERRNFYEELWAALVEGGETGRREPGPSKSRKRRRRS